MVCAGQSFVVVGELELGDFFLACEMGIDFYVVIMCAKEVSSWSSLFWVRDDILICLLRHRCLLLRNLTVRTRIVAFRGVVSNTLSPGLSRASTEIAQSLSVVGRSSEHFTASNIAKIGRFIKLCRALPLKIISINYSLFSDG